MVKKTEDHLVVLTIRCTPEEAERIRREAADTHRSVSEFMTHAALAYIDARKGNHSPFVHSSTRLH